MGGALIGVMKRAEAGMIRINSRRRFLVEAATAFLAPPTWHPQPARFTTVFDVFHCRLLFALVTPNQDVSNSRALIGWSAFKPAELLETSELGKFGGIGRGVFETLGCRPFDGKSCANDEKRSGATRVRSGSSWGNFRSRLNWAATERTRGWVRGGRHFEGATKT